MNVLVWVGFGIVGGAIAHFLDSRSARGGIMGAMLMGIAGSILGGVTANYLFGIDFIRFDLTSLIIASAGTILLLFIHRTVFTDTAERF
ncbi:MAG: GlsB/YeaQ/YmgE family stress response membrane protein [Candidatus Levybacteria bacterium]|nr:GlsB/YeaQ/YmgE family stress response membrane protein [Candidatus Levybacteria bacterium]